MILGRVGFALATLVLISVVTFWATSRSPEQAARSALGREVTHAQMEIFIHENDLDRPIYTRYAQWLSGFVQGDWGTVLANDQPVRSEILPRLRRTLTLAFFAIVLSVPIALALAMFMARRAGRWSDITLLTGTTLITALPEFLIAIGLLYVFGVWLGWLPVDSSAIAFGSSAQKVKTYVLPIASLVIVCIPYTVRMARGALRETLAADYTRAAVLRGLPRRTVLRDYALRNAAVPIVNTMALILIYLISGVVVIENVFGFPGIGQRLVEAVQTGDTDTVQAIALLMGAFFIAITLAADLLALYFNPRLRSR